MSEDRWDAAIDAAARELMTDAPDALLNGVMYRIERDEKPRRFAFGRFTALAAAAAAAVILFSFRNDVFSSLRTAPDSFSGSGGSEMNGSTGGGPAPASGGTGGPVYDGFTLEQESALNAVDGQRPAAEDSDGHAAMDAGAQIGRAHV